MNIMVVFGFKVIAHGVDCVDDSSSLILLMLHCDEMGLIGTGNKTGGIRTL